MEPTSQAQLDQLLAHSSWMHALARSLVGREDADDLLQDTWGRLLHAPPDPTRPPRPWIARVMLNLARTSWRSRSRRRRRENAAATPEALPSTGEIVLQMEWHSTLARAVSALSEPNRSTIVARYFQGRSSAQIAQELGVPESTVRSRLKRGLDELRAQLDRRSGNRSTWVTALAPLGALRPGPALSKRPLQASVATAAASTLPLSFWPIAAAVLLIAAVVLWVATSPSRPPEADLRTAAVPGETSAPGRAARPEAAPEPAPVSTPSTEPRAGLAPATGSTTGGGPRTAFIEVRMQDELGAPIEGGELIVLDPARPYELELRLPGLARSRSGPDGRARVEVPLPAVAPAEPSWPHHVALLAAGRALVTEHASAEAGRTTSLGSITLRPGGTLAGRVVIEGGAPFPPRDVSVASGASVGGEVRTVRVGTATSRTIELRPSKTTAIGGATELGAPPPSRGPAAGSGVSIVVEEPSARVAETPCVCPTKPPPLRSARVEQDGSFEIEGLPVGPVRLQVRSSIPGYYAEPGEPSEVRAGERTRCADIVLKLRPSVVSGTVTSHSGRPAIQHVKYKAKGVDGPDGWMLSMSDAAGRFQIDVPGAAAYDLYFNALGGDLGETVLRDVPAGTRGLEVRLPAPRFLDLRVVDEQGQPLPKYSVMHRDVSGRSSAGGYAPRPDGRAQVMIRAEPHTYRVSWDGFEEEVLGPFDLGSFPPTLEIVLERVPAVAGRVTSDGAPVERAEVLLLGLVPPDAPHLGNGFPLRLQWPQLGLPSLSSTKADGSFAITERLPGTYVLLVRVEGRATFESPPFDHDPGAGRSFEVVLGKGGVLEGRVKVAPGASPEGTVVGIARGDGYARTTRVGPDGNYRFEALAAGPWHIRRCEQESDLVRDIRRSDGTDATLASFEVQEGETARCDLDLSAAECVVEGWLDGAGEASWTATLVTGGERGGKEVQVGPDGSFRIETQILGPHRLTLVADRGAGVTQKIEQSLVVLRGPTSWQGSLVTGSLRGTTLPRASLVHVVRLPNGADCTTRFQADDAGAFALDGVPIGSGTIRAGSEGVARDVTVSAGAATTVTL